MLVRLWAALRERLGEADLALFQGVLVEGRLVREVAGELGVSEAAAFRRSHRLEEKIERISGEVLGAKAVEPGRSASPLVVLMLASVLVQALVR